ncbi:lipase family protein [Amycolatopsis sp. GM8]|uniref:lipase family protein n=1 Tax=Amycolatopsis sp. GM8 TaxID=2896530 RepID=UPI001F3C172E|nr:lipase family protein [Amycolatopsis sp. GM8]
MGLSLRGSARWAVAAVAATLLTAVATVPAAAATTSAQPSSPTSSVVLPDDDPFYAVPPHLEGKRDGTVLRSRQLPASALATPAPAQVWQVLYKTRDNAGRATATAGTLLVPTARWQGPGPRPLVSYQVPEDALTTACAPSYLLRAGSTAAASTIAQANFDRGQVAAAVQRGWTVMVPDWEGPRSEFFGADAAAHGVLDGVRAARSFGPAHVDRKAPVGLWGYSGGGFATASAAQEQSAYAPELKISGIAEGGVPADINAALQSISGQPFSGWIPFAFATLGNAYPRFDIDRYLNASARSYADADAHVCAGDAIAAGPFNTKLESFEAWPGSLTSGTFSRFARQISPLGIGGTPTAPVYMYHGTADELLPVTAARELKAQYLARGANVVMIEDQGQTHGGEQAFGVAGAVSFLEKQFSQHH